jgi:hypothetical protein
VLTDADFAVTECIRQPSRDDGTKTFVIAHVRFVRANKIHVSHFMRYDAEEVAFNGLRVEIDNPFLVIHTALAKLLIWGPLDFDGPPFAVQLEAHDRAFLAVHFSR